MSSFETTAERVTKAGAPTDQALPGLAVMVADDTGAIRYSKAFGSSSKGPVTVDSTFWIASCTKLLTTVAVLQCVERGLLNLDDPVESLLPELANLDILYGFDENTGAPLLKKAKNKITMRHLLTHSSGLGYDMMHPDLIRWRKFHGQEQTSRPDLTIAECAYPLLFEPGEGFVYGVSIDWAGRAVERLNNNIRLGEYFQKHIWEPLGMWRSTFTPSEHPVVRENLIDMVLRTPDGLQPIPHPLGATPPVDEAGGAGMFSSVSDYIKVLVSLLKNDGKLLKPESVDQMFQPQLPDPKYLHEVLQHPDINRGMTMGIQAGKQWNWGLGGLLAMEETPGRRSKGTLSWSGMPNPAWWIDRTRKTCGMMGIQLLPFFDHAAISLYGELEALAWEKFSTTA
ncbi:hypothetical protein VTO42DRAFT_843 [Malbranchea cinnamomea]